MMKQERDRFGRSLFCLGAAAVVRQLRKNPHINLTANRVHSHSGHMAAGIVYTDQGGETDEQVRSLIISSIRTDAFAYRYFA